MLTSDQQVVTGVNFVTEEMVEMRWKNKEEFMESSGRTNVVIAAYTTAQARLQLYSYLEKLGSRAMYADTDSIVFTVAKGEWEPSLGDYLGELKDEVPLNNITHLWQRVQKIMHTKWKNRIQQEFRQYVKYAG
jgi:hypothetical protein